MGHFPRGTSASMIIEVPPALPPVVVAGHRRAARRARQLGAHPDAHLDDDLAGLRAQLQIGHLPGSGKPRVLSYSPRSRIARLLLRGASRNRYSIPHYLVSGAPPTRSPTARASHLPRSFSSCHLPPVGSTHTRSGRPHFRTGSERWA
jgi:hypothetical protein